VQPPACRAHDVRARLVLPRECRALATHLLLQNTALVLTAAAHASGFTPRASRGPPASLRQPPDDIRLPQARQPAHAQRLAQRPQLRERQAAEGLLCPGAVAARHRRRLPRACASPARPAQEPVSEETGHDPG